MAALFVRRFLLMMKMIVSFALLGGSLALAQIAGPANAVPQPSAQTSPMPYGLSQSINQLEQVSQSAVANLGRVRVDKWKTDNNYKQQAKGNIESLQRNLSAAVPALVQQVRNNPGSLAASVKLYRNLNAVYDVLASVTESTGAFGSKDDYNALANDTSNLDNVRRILADQLEEMAASLDAQVGRLTAQVRSQQAATAAAPPKRVIVDDNAPAKKTTKKKPVPKPPAKKQ